MANEPTKPVSRSPWVVHFNCNSCNGCDIEFLACLTPMYDLERFGILHVGNPKHADVLVVTGSVNHRTARVLLNVYDQIPSPKVVVALGVCSSSGGIFADGYNVIGGIDQVIPVDVFVPGCPPRPEAMIDGILQGAAILEAKRTRPETVSAAKPRIVHTPPAAPAALPSPVQAAVAAEVEKLMLEEAKDVERDHVENEVAILHRQGYRFVTMTCLDAGEAHEIIYHFDKQYRMRNLRLRLPKGTPLPSISPLYFSANLIENEIKDMFGVHVEGLGIDFHGRFLLAEDAPQTPLNKNCGMKVDVRVRPPAATTTSSERNSEA